MLHFFWVLFPSLFPGPDCLLANVTLMAAFWCNHSHSLWPLNMCMGGVKCVRTVVWSQQVEASAMAKWYSSKWFEKCPVKSALCLPVSGQPGSEEDSRQFPEGPQSGGGLMAEYLWVQDTHTPPRLSFPPFPSCCWDTVEGHCPCSTWWTSTWS